MTPRYKQFLNDYVFAGHNLKYNLGDLFYRRVRCGLDHSFSTGSGKNKQEIIVLLDHEEYGFPEEVKIKKKDKTICIGIVFNSLDMIELLKMAIVKIFDKANLDNNLKQQIITRFNDKNPLSTIYK